MFLVGYFDFCLSKNVVTLNGQHIFSVFLKL